ncbi:hypothetical protein EW093_09235 [Thiospirochaeta perfilievii]|uniref:Tail specific protease domain-containing protein n=1 Tax=Thiospirochaeta perfilievii TaxID=252967 RepID=A0A5C1QCU4_9SPIO|nr:S41 family peptidase [Thiospirochaeta perfilievii]QEN04880.1 hypothetical protein EW093_09235 [Thiospirochaeta perfilievii]
MNKIITFLAVLLILSCNIPYIDNEYDSDHISTFNYFCDELKNHYVFTELKNIDIESRRSYYLENEITNNQTEEEFFLSFSKFVNEFKDGHTNIIAPFSHSSAYSIILDESDIDFNSNYNSWVIKYNYLNDNPVFVDSLKHGIIQRGGKSYGYIYYGSFMDRISSSQIEDYILKRFYGENVEGIILDIRSNGGGNLLNAITLVSYFGYDETSQTKEALKVWRRDGIDRYTKIDSLAMTLGVTVPFTITTNPNGYKGPVALLTNRGCYSAASFTATAFKSYPNVKQIGQDTGGGMGLPVGGTLPNGWRYRFSSNIAMPSYATGYDDEVNNYENGVPVDFSAVDILGNEIDEIIDRAILWIDSY